MRAAWMRRVAESTGVGTRLIACAGAAALVASLGWWAADTAAAAPAEPTSVTGLDFSWSVNPESGASAYAGGCNFLSAGVAGDAGSSRVWTEQDGFYRTADGPVSITKPAADGTWATPTWASKCQDRTGAAVSVAKGSVTENRVTIANGAGEISADARDARLNWSGGFTVVFYGGMTYWSVEDVALSMSGGNGALTATATGYEASMDDPGVWSRIDRVPVTLATFSGASLTRTGGTISPDFAGVEVSSTRGEQNRDRAGWGSFPQDFIAFQDRTGQAQYWFTTGGAADPRKTAAAVTIGVADGPAPTTPGTTNPGPTAPGTTNPAPTTPGSTTPAPGTGAVFAWGLNRETGSGAFYGGCNFLSAGSGPDHGRSQLWTAQDYRTEDGNVRIVKETGNGRAAPTWANKCSDRTGQAVSANRLGSYTESQVEIHGGAVTRSPEGAVSVQWRGSFTVAFYGGLTFWTATDPQLTLDAQGNGRITATAGGFGASMEDSSKWQPLAPRTVTLATLRSVDRSASDRNGGFEHTPEYLGVSYAVSGGGAEVVGGGESATNQAPRSAENAEYWGAFPSDFIDFQNETGQFSWFTSGGQRDPAKPALPVFVSFDDSYQQPAAGAYSGGGSGPAAVAQRPGAAPRSGGGGAGAAGAQAPAPEQIAAEDGTAFASVAATEAGAAAPGVEVSPLMLAGAGAGLVGVAGVNGAVAFLLRRRLGLDPGTYV